MKPDTFFHFDPGAMPQATLQQALLFHRMAHLNTYSYYGKQDFAASLHDVKIDNNGQPVIGAGRLLAREDIEAMLKSMLDLKPAQPVLIPKNVLSCSEKHIAWTVPGRVRPILFNFPGKPLIKFDVPWPNLLLLATSDGKLSAAALKARMRPTEKTRLYHAPLMNINSFGSVCTGSAKLPVSCAIDQLPVWESVMFETAFSHINHQRTLLLSKGGDIDTHRHFKFWKALSRKNVATFPTEHLVPSGLDLGMFLSRALR